MKRFAGSGQAAGDDLLLPRGANVQWKATENVVEYYALFDSGSATENLPMPNPSIIRLSKEGEGKGLAGRGRSKEYMYMKGLDGSEVGVWETEPYAAPEFHKTKYAEIMVFLSGDITLTTPSRAETFHAGDVVIVPRGIDYKWSSGPARKFYVIFDNEPTAADAK